MKVSKALIALSCVLSWSGAALAQDPAKVDSAHYKVVVDNPSVRVLKIDYPAGDKSPMHQHPDAIVVPLAATKVKFTLPDGKSQERELANEAAEYMPGGLHSPANVGTGAVDALLIEFKAAAPGTAALPATREGLGMKMLAEGPRAVAYRTSADPKFQEPAGSKHDYDQVVIALSDAKMSLSIDGKPAKTSWKRGEVQFIGRGVAHESKNETGKPIDFVIVAVR
jgi:quercetin dioxygenase-like cupin family protein